MLPVSLKGEDIKSVGSTCHLSPDSSFHLKCQMSSNLAQVMFHVVALLAREKSGFALLISCLWLWKVCL